MYIWRHLIFLHQTNAWRVIYKLFVSLISHWTSQFNTKHRTFTIYVTYKRYLIFIHQTNAELSVCKYLWIDVKTIEDSSPTQRRGTLVFVTWNCTKQDTATRHWNTSRCGESPRKQPAHYTNWSIYLFLFFSTLAFTLLWDQHHINKLINEQTSAMVTPLGSSSSSRICKRATLS